MPKGNAILTAINAERKSLAKKLKALDRAAKHVGGEATKRVVRRKKRADKTEEAPKARAKAKGKAAATKPSSAGAEGEETKAEKRARLLGKKE